MSSNLFVDFTLSLARKPRSSIRPAEQLLCNYVTMLDLAILQTPTQLKERKKTAKEVVISDQDREAYAAFVAIRCAAASAQAQLALSQISGDTSITRKSLEQETWHDIPQFMILDLVGDYVIGEQRKIYKGELLVTRRSINKRDPYGGHNRHVLMWRCASLGALPVM